MLNPPGLSGEPKCNESYIIKKQRLNIILQDIDEHILLILILNKDSKDTASIYRVIYIKIWIFNRMDAYIKEKAKSTYI